MALENPHSEWAYGWEEIKRFLPHRYPFLLIDRVLSVRNGEDPATLVGTQVHAMKCVTGNEEVLQGHFPHRAIMPGVLLIEMMAQTAMFSVALRQAQAPFGLLSKVESCRFRSMVQPGDILDIFTSVVSERGGFLGCEGYIVERQKAIRICEVKFMAYLEDKKDVELAPHSGGSRS